MVFKRLIAQISKKVFVQKAHTTRPSLRSAKEQGRQSRITYKQRLTSEQQKAQTFKLKQLENVIITLRIFGYDPCIMPVV